MFSKLIKAQQSIAPLLGTSFRLIWAGAITAAMSCFFFQEEIMRWLYLGADAYWAEIMGLLMLTFVAVSGSYIWGSLLTANGNLRAMNGLLSLGVLANVVLNFVLIPEYKALGAAWATLVTQFLVLFAQMGLAKKLFRLKLRVGDVLQIVGFCLVLLLMVYVCYGFLPFDWRLNFVISILLGLLLALLFRMIQPQILGSILPRN